MHDDDDSTADARRTLMEAREILSSCLSDSNKTHYVVCIPSLSNTIKVSSDFQDVLKLMKEHKNQNPRMLSFPSLAEAETFANKHTANEVCQGATIKSNYPQEKAEVELTEMKLFPSLTTPQLNEFRMLLEKGNINVAVDRILTNPRYLVLNIDMPTILKEGARYNALHSSVIAGQLESCRLVMEMISDVEYLKRLYETQKRAEENSKRLIDLYLNTPDKVANKTPLHFASERGFVDIVAFLVSFKVCIRNFNHHIHETVKKGHEQYEKLLMTGETPEEVACSRYKGPNAASIKARIVNLIRGGTCYVPLIRSDTTGPYAKVGDPYTPTSPYKLVSEIEDVLRPTPAANLDMDSKDFRNMKVWAYAGPMSPKDAEDFRREWRSPRHSQSVRENHKVIDGDRGFERFGRELADSHSTSWQEYWPFLDAFADLRSEEGLDQLDLFFQKQQVINLMQTLLRKVNFVTASPYHINKEYILVQDWSDSEGSEEENEAYFSAESPSCSEEDVLDGPEIDREKNENGSTVSPVKGGVLSSIWSGIVKFKNIFSPGSIRTKQNIGSESNTSVMNTKRDSSQFSPNSSIDSGRSKTRRLEFESSGDVDSKKSSLRTVNHICHLNENNQSCVTTDRCSCNCKVDIIDSVENVASVTATERSTTQQISGIHSQQDEAGTSILPLSKVLQHADTESDSKVRNSSSDISDTHHLCIDHVQNITSHDDIAAGTNSVPIKNELQTPDKWKYRTHAQSPESDCSTPERKFTDQQSPTSFHQDVESPTSQAELFVKIANSLQVCSEKVASTSQMSPSGMQLDDSFNTKMDSCSRNLEKFSILSPNSSPSVSTTTTPSSPSSKLDSDTEPSVHIFTGKLYSKIMSQLKSQTYTNTTRFKSENLSQLPTLFLRQSDDNNTVLADLYLPGTQWIEDSLSKAQSQILNESTHKEAVKNVWINLLVIFATPSEAKRLTSLTKDEVVCAVIEGTAEEKDVCGIRSDNKVDQANLKELFIKSKDNLYESKHSDTLVVKVVRTACLPHRDVFVCGTIPTKVDADVYHTLNNRACQLIYKHPNRFSHVSLWFNKMSKQGTDSINSLPSPSRVLRLERRDLPPVSKLVGTPFRSNTSQTVTGVTPSTATIGGKQSDRLVRKLFEHEFNNGNK